MRQAWFRKRFGVGGRVHIGTGCKFFAPEAMHFEGLVKIGDNSFFAAPGGAIVVGNETAFNAGVHINASVGGEIHIGKWCLIGPNVVMRTAGHNFNKIDIVMQKQGHTILNIQIDDDVWIGSNVVILGGVKIGKGAVIGAGAVVTKDIPPFSIAVGIPARTIKYREQQEKKNE